NPNDASMRPCSSTATASAPVAASASKCAGLPRSTIAVASASAAHAVPATTVANVMSLAPGRPVVGSMMWCRTRPSTCHRRRDAGGTEAEITRSRAVERRARVEGPVVTRAEHVAEHRGVEQAAGELPRVERTAYEHEGVGGDVHRVTCSAIELAHFAVAPEPA